MKHTDFALQALYSQSHDWLHVLGDVATIGITHFAEKELGEVVYVELPRVGIMIKADEEVAVLESTKAAVDIYSPLSGKIIEINKELISSPGKVNTDPEGGGWLYRLQITNPNELASLMSEDDYKNYLKV